MALIAPSTTTSRVRTAARVTVAVLALVLVGCGSSSSSAPSGTTAAGFPVGSFSKLVDAPDLGPTQFVWTFTADGQYTEVPFALDGQRLDIAPVRGTFIADADTVTIATTWPPDMGTSTHGWRLDGDQLWTFLMDSTNPNDKEWFEGLDSRPWEPYRS